MKIELARSEVSQFADAPWELMNPEEKRWCAANIMRNRPDAQSQEFAFLIESNNPNANEFVIVENA